MKLKSSPYYILIFIRRFALLLLTLPLQTLLMINSKLHTKVFFVATDILIFGAIFLCALISLQGISLSAATSRFTLKRGVIRKQKLTFERRKLQSISVSRNILQRLLGVCKVTLVSSTAKGEIFLSIKNLAYLPCSLPHKKAQSTCIFKSKLSDILIMSAGLSPALGAALSFAPFVRSLSKLSAEDISSANLWDMLGYKGLPPLLAVLSSLLFILWLMGTILSFLRLCNLSLCKTKDHLQISRGFLSKHHTVFTSKNIRAVVFSQSLIMLLLCRQSANIVLASEERSAHITAGCIRNYSDALLMQKTLCIKAPEDPSITASPRSNTLISYTLLPLISLSGLSAFSIFISKVSPYKIEPHLGAFLCLWCCVWFLHRCFAFCHSSISLSDRTLRIRTYSKFSFLDIFIPTDHIRCAQITQNIFQRFKGTCNLRVFVRYKKRKSYIIRHISSKKAAELKSKLCG